MKMYVYTNVFFEKTRINVLQSYIKFPFLGSSDEYIHGTKHPICMCYLHVYLVESMAMSTH